MMISKRISLIMCMVLLAMLVSTVGGFAQSLPASCQPANGGESVVLSVGTGANTSIIATAANYYGPAQAMVNNFQQTSNGANTAITICSNATGVFERDINNNFPTKIYDALFAADGSVTKYTTGTCSATPDNITTFPCAAVGDAFLYANGLPVLFGYKEPSLDNNITNMITDVSDLITGPVSLQNVLAYNVPASAAAYQINTTLVPSANYLEIADPNVAPYGEQAVAIMSDMIGSNITWTPPGLPTSTTINLDTAQNQNVGTTFNLVGKGSVKSGFVGKSQICAILPIVAYAQFSDYTLQQLAVQLTNNQTATYLNSYIAGQKGIQATLQLTQWDVFLVNNCYAPVGN